MPVPTHPSVVNPCAIFAFSWAFALVALNGCSDAESSTWAWGGGGGAAGEGGSAGVGASAGAAGEPGGAGGVGPVGGAAGDAGSSGTVATPYVAIISPADGSQVENPVGFSFEASGVTSVALLAEGQYEIPISWDPTQAATHDMTYTFSGLGMRTLSLHGYLGSSTPVASDTIEIEVTAPALCDGFDTEPLLTPSDCDASGGKTSSEIPGNGLYATSWFGCYRKDDGTIYKDPYDNCEFACGPMGYCPSGQSGPECEAELQWFAADADRYGCGGLIRVTNCHNGRSVVLVTLDRGPNCVSVEQSCDAPVLDMSYPAMVHLFEGSTHGGCDHARVVVEEVPEGTALGPE